MVFVPGGRWSVSVYPRRTAKAQRLRGGCKLYDGDELREGLGCGGELVDLLVWHLCQVRAERRAGLGAVVLERGDPGVGQLDKDDSAVVGLALASRPF